METLNDLRFLVDELLETPLFSLSSCLEASDRSPSLMVLSEMIDRTLPRKANSNRQYTLRENFLREASCIFEVADEVLSTLFSIVMQKPSAQSIEGVMTRQERLVRIIKDLDA